MLGPPQPLAYFCDSKCSPHVRFPVALIYFSVA